MGRTQVSGGLWWAGRRYKGRGDAGQGEAREGLWGTGLGRVTPPSPPPSLLETPASPGAGATACRLALRVGFAVVFITFSA